MSTMIYTSSPIISRSLCPVGSDRLFEMFVSVRLARSLLRMAAEVEGQRMRRYATRRSEVKDGQIARLRR